MDREKRFWSYFFILFCLPFSPSALINVVAGLSRISQRQFALALFAWKGCYDFFIISYVGHDLLSFVQKPLKTAIAVLVIFPALVCWEKKVEVRLELAKK
ncbi:hypothetical protein GCM10020331_080430 [Ectobacillus funiculus]